MYFKQLVSVAMAIALGATKAAAITHGDVEDYQGGKIKWQQIGKGMWSGIPLEEWEDSVHKRSDVELDLDFVQPEEVHPRSLELQSRNLESFCQSVATCVNGDGLVQLTGCMGAYVEAAAAAAGTATALWDFLNKPFVATVTGATISGIIVKKGVSEPSAEPSECSTSDSDKDALLSALSAAVSRDPTAYSVSTDVSGPTTFYTVTITAVPEDQTPPTPVSGQCFTA